MFNMKYLFFIFITLLALVTSAPVPTGTVKIIAEKDHKEILARLTNELHPPRDKAIFWSGDVEGVSSRTYARAYAGEAGKKTILMALQESNIPFPNTRKDPFFNPFWNLASGLWSERANGVVEIFFGAVEARSIYISHEKQLLAANKKITNIIEHDLYVSTFFPL